MTIDNQEILAFFDRLKEAGITEKQILEIVDKLETVGDNDTAKVTTELWTSLLRKGIYNKFPAANNMIVEAMLATIEYVAEEKIIQALSGDRPSLDTLEAEMTLYGEAVISVLKRINKT